MTKEQLFRVAMCLTNISLGIGDEKFAMCKPWFDEIEQILADIKAGMPDDNGGGE